MDLLADDNAHYVAECDTEADWEPDGEEFNPHPLDDSIAVDLNLSFAERSFEEDHDDGD